MRIDRKRKLPATTFMMALPDVESEAYMEACAEKSQEVDPARVNGMSREEILRQFYQTVNYSRKGDGWQYDFDRVAEGKAVRDLIDANSKSYRHGWDKNDSPFTQKAGRYWGEINFCVR